MNWAKTRQLIIWSSLGAVVVAILAAVAFVTIYDVPSCGDKKQNQDETGIDCGGSCTKVCAFEAESPRILFVRPLQSGQKTDVIAYIENRNETAAAKNVAYTVELFDANNALVATKKGVLDIPVRARALPLFIPSAYSGNTTITHAFITLSETIDWQKAVPVEETQLPSVAAPTVTGVDTPKVTATVRNPQPLSLFNVKVIAAVFDRNNSVMAASQTVLREVPAQGEAVATFTWGTPFPSEYTKIEILPLYP